jgi:hypothetical protein
MAISVNPSTLMACATSRPLVLNTQAIAHAEVKPLASISNSSLESRHIR